MGFDYRCFFCFNRTMERLLKDEKITAEKANVFTKSMMKIYYENHHEFSSPLVARELHSRIKEFSQNPDPYKVVKKESNDLVLSMYNELEMRIRESINPFNTALRLSIAGNIIDFGVSYQYNLTETVDLALNSDFSIDHSKLLYEELKNARTVLYLGDNNGEAVLDKLFIETIAHPNLYFAVRGAPIINDVTLEDAKYIGIDRVSKLVSNGFDAPSTIIDQCSDEFQQVFNEADLIISKGQGNFEGLQKIKGKNIFFMLMVKCDVIAENLGTSKGSFVVQKKHHN